MGLWNIEYHHAYQFPGVYRIVYQKTVWVMADGWTVICEYDHLDDPYKFPKIGEQ